MSEVDEQPERQQTDESLRRERDRADLALASSLRRVEAATEAVVRTAVEGAEARVEEARAQVDEQQATEAPATKAQVDAERASSDLAAAENRAIAEKALRIASEEQARVLLRLLPLEREKTDRYLLTERLRADEAVDHRDDFFNIVTHDLRNLLSGVVLSTDALSANIDEEAPAAILKSSTERIGRYVARMHRLIEDLVDVGSIDQGRLAIERSRGDVLAVMAEAVDGFQSAAVAKALTLRVATTEGPLWSNFDRHRVLQVLANLLSNAIKFTPKGGEVELHGERTSDAIRVSVRDTGGGIPEAMRESVFERFWQVGRNDRRGQGLGLYISRSIVEAHGGTIWVESELGHGSRFYFELPVGLV
jgi:signal transduction histidine kinase